MEVNKKNGKWTENKEQGNSQKNFTENLNMQQNIIQGINNQQRKIMDSIAFVILQGIVCGLTATIYTGKISDILLSLLNFNIKESLMSAQISALNTFLAGLTITVITSFILTLIIWQIIKIFKDNNSFADIFFITGIWCIVTIPIILLSFFTAFLNKQLAIILDCPGIVLSYIFLVYLYIKNKFLVYEK